MEDTITLDPEAQQRIDQVRLRQLSFRIKTLYPALADDDVETLAVALMEVFDEGKTPVAGDLQQRLMRHGQSSAGADALVMAIGLKS